MTERIHERYEPIEVAGSGGQGEVVRALDHQHGRTVALKIRTLGTEDDREAILSEARVLLGLTPHPNLPLVRDDWFEDDDRYVMVVDWIEGRSLQDEIEKRGDPGLPVGAVLGWLTQIADAIDHLHSHRPPIVHADVKPANIILTPDGRAVLVDFGISGVVGASPSAGTQGFISPEVGAGERPSPASDIFSLGATAFASLTGAPPAGARPGWEGVAADSAGVIERALRRALASDPARRPATARDLVEQLGGWLDSALPEGTVTFLATDLPGSAALWESSAETMTNAIKRHDATVAETVERNGGRLLRSRGDDGATLSAFADASAAVTAAVEIQRVMVSARWGVDIRMRIAVHTGEAHRAGGEYEGAAIHRIALVRGLGSAGQIVCSGATADLVSGSLPGDVTLRDLGEHRLRDLQRPERLVQIVHPELPAEFAAIGSAESVPNNLPSALSSLIGRAEQLSDGAQMLDDARLVTLTGLGGIGKTRIALRLAGDVLERFPGGVWLAELSALRDPALVTQTVADAAGVRATAGTPLDALANEFRSSRALIVLDTCEHLIDACASFAEAMLRACSELRVLATSTEPLGVAGEALLIVPPLDVPPERAGKDIASVASVALFAERARLARPEFRLEDDEAMVAQICRTLDGIPLAIELAAARVKVLKPAQIAERLSDRFKLLASSSRSAAPQQQTLRAALDWSYDLLNESERALFHRLAVFVGGCSLDAAEEACAGPPVDDVLDGISALVDRSLVVADESGEDPRYRMLQTVAAYARERLAASGEEKEMRARHLRYFGTFAGEAMDELRGRDQGRWLARVTLETDNVRAAIDEAFAKGDDDEAVGIVCALGQWWTAGNRVGEGRALLARASGSIRDPSLLASAEGLAGFLAFQQTDLAEANELLSSALARARTLDDRTLEARITNNLAMVAFRKGDVSGARTMFEESLSLRRSLGQEGEAASVLTNLGALVASEDPESAAAAYEEALGLARVAGVTRTEAAVLNNLGWLREQQGDLARAEVLYMEALTLHREMGVRADLKDSLDNLAAVVRARGDMQRARALNEESLEIGRELGDRRSVAMTLTELVAVLQGLGDTEGAHRCATEAVEVALTTGIEDVIKGAQHALASLS